MLRDDLALRIANGMWKAGALLPSESQLAKGFGVSQGTVRKALDLLEGEKIISRRQGRGTLVVDHDSEEMAIRFSAIYGPSEERIAGRITWDSAEFAMPTMKEQAGLRIGPSEQVLRVHRIREYLETPFLFEISTLVVRYFSGVTAEMVRGARISAIAQKCGVQLSYARESVVPVISPEDICEKLKLEDLQPILQLERTVYKKDGLPAELRVGWCHLGVNRYMTIMR
jgi:GntR family transcriptional regulator